MCGIFGFIGKSQDNLASWTIANALMIKTESRGSDATGFWASERGDSKRVFFDKEAIKSTVYVDRDIWKNKFRESNCDILLGHCRQCSVGVGNEKVNRNNHPHASADRSLALVHNGRVPEYTALKSRYELHGECDSEILLAMYQTGWQYKGQDDYLAQNMPHLPPHLAYRAMGLMEIFRYIHYAAVAMAIGERGENGERFIWLNRDNERPIHVVDLRETLGQIFFFSTPEIWKNAISSIPEEMRKKYIPNNHDIGIFQPDEVWLLRIKPEDEDKDSWIIDKFKVARSKYQDYNAEEDDPPIQFRRPEAESELEVVSRLNEKEEVVVVNNPVATTSTSSTNSGSPESFPLVRRDGSGAEILDTEATNEKKKDFHPRA